jgi:hypothetical protein
MKKSILYLAVMVSAITFLTISCAIEKGCMDKDSINYNEDAVEDDGSCEYEGSIVIWYNQPMSNFLIGDNAFTLTFYVDGQIAGSIATSVYWSSAPNCGQNGAITVIKNLGNSDSKSFSFRAIDQTNFEYFSGTIEFTANQCKNIELIF